MESIEDFMRECKRPSMLYIKSYEEWIRFDDAWNSLSFKAGLTKKDFLYDAYLKLDIDKNFEDYLNIIKASISRAKRQVRKSLHKSTRP